MTKKRISKFIKELFCWHDWGYWVHDAEHIMKLKMCRKCKKKIGALCNE